MFLNSIMAALHTWPKAKKYDLGESTTHGAMI